MPKVLRAVLAAAFSMCACASASALDADDALLMPQYAEVLTGRSLRLHALSIHCADAQAKACNDHLHPLEVVEWRVNGIPGGSAEVGTVTGGSEPVYTAPRSLPSGNPVSLSGIVKGTGRTQVQVVSEIQVVQPSQWQGSVSYSFTGLLDANAHDQEQVAHLDQVWAWLTPADDAAASDVTKVSLSVQYLVRGVMVDSVGQDMSGLVVFELGVPTAVFGYQRRFIDGCGGTTLTTRVGKVALEGYSAVLPTLNLMINADGTSVLPYVPPPIMTSTGLETALDCENFFTRIELEEQGEDLDTPIGTELVSRGTVQMTMPRSQDPADDVTREVTDFAFTHAFKGGSAKHHVYAGSITRKAMMRFQGQDIPGLLSVQWSFSPQ